MRKIHCPSLMMGGFIFAFLVHAGAAYASDRGHVINQNQAGISLPGVSSPSGFDEVRAADGTTCRASMSNGGSFIDAGVIGNGVHDDRASLSTYGRLVIPLGRQPKRLDCDRLYQLELRRLQLEVKLLEQGLAAKPGETVPGGAGAVDWTESGGWTDVGRQ
ncbi:hypothetical protein AB2N04_10250 [Nitratireductor sp. GISD-1A_MAKvit]|uniref:hypothetical protein n=1 Tax=Nitratireductor sp. GISD-1A_MAKvit TaxID=3234198 RepID=UPI00346788E4